jgi:thiamine-monophosphate kinase
MNRLRDTGEFGLIRSLARWLAQQRPVRSRRHIIADIGDDCAVLRPDPPGHLLLYTCDPVVAGIHYAPGAPPRRIGWKAMARNLSDIAAMGGLPRWAVVSIGLRPDTPLRHVREIYRGLRDAAARFDCEIVGGDTTRVRRDPFVVVALLGRVEPQRLVRRSGSRVGDSVFVTGRLGGSRRGKHLRFIPRITEARWLTRHFPIHAMIDLSDGLSSDLRRLVEADRQRIGFEIIAAELPLAPAARGSLRAALDDGEDFELLFTVDPRQVSALRRNWARRFQLQLTEIGRVVRAPGRVSILHPDGSRAPLLPAGHDHFANR